MALVGATATGKTALAEALAAILDAEVVCADSRQVYRELEAGTGKPTPEERRARPHHLFDALELGQRASAGWYARAAAETLESVRHRGRLALLCGGSGLWIRAAERGLAGEPPHDPAVRGRLRAELEALGPEALHARLAGVDPETAARLMPRDRQRVSRALEVWESSGRPLSWWHAHAPATALRERWGMIELVVPAATLRERIARRTRAMLDPLVEETRSLLARGRGEALRALRAIGYDEAIDLIEGDLDREQAETSINRRTAQLAKRQRTWFRHQVRAVRLEAQEGAPESVLERALDAFRHGGAAGAR